MEEYINKYSLLNGINVPRETFLTFEKLIELIIQKNRKINIISNESQENMRKRHIIDSAQAIDLIDLNGNICTDIGAGGGMPGLVLAIMIKSLNKNVKIELYEKSYHKSAFLREVSRKLNLTPLLRAAFRLAISRFIEAGLTGFPRYGVSDLRMVLYFSI